MCGLCLPHCPTYNLTLDENESPRGRISLVRALLLGAFENNPKTSLHLEHCLLCRACEKVCPSGVEYGRIIDGIRAGQAATTSSVTLSVTDKRGLLRLNHLLWWYQKSGLQKLVRGLHLLGNTALARKENLLPTISRQQAWAEHYPARVTKRGQLQLFTGCISNSLDHRSLRDAVAVLTQLGYDVSVPSTQGCCGALDLHRGDTPAFTALAADNSAAFNDSTARIISLHSGCTATLRDHVKNDVLDVCDFLVKEGIAPAFQPLKKRVVVHSPCTQKNVLRSANNVSRILQTIPGLELIELPATLSCCGAAGSYMLDFPEQADAIRASSIEAISAANADILVTSNIGCGMHLAAGLRKAGLHLDVMHPVELIAMQLDREG